MNHVRFGHRLVAAAAAVAGLTAAASASVITLAGGDAGEGFAPLPTVVSAINVGGNAPVTLQGVTFSADAGRSYTGTGGDGNSNFTATVPTGATSDDVALRTLLGTGGWNYWGYASYSFTGLDPSRTYQIDAFTLVDGGPRNTSITAVGATTVSDTAYSVTDTAQIIQLAVSPSSEGTIEVRWALGSGENPNNDGSGLINALAVSTAVPEPASLGMLALTGILALRRKR